jgi:hypothetical protein
MEYPAPAADQSEGFPIANGEDPRWKRPVGKRSAMMFCSQRMNCCGVPAEGTNGPVAFLALVVAARKGVRGGLKSQSGKTAKAINWSALRPSNVGWLAAVALWQ